MKNLLILFLALMSTNCVAQNLYDMRWSSDGIDYYGFMIYFNEDDVYMRIGYEFDGGYNLAHTEYVYTSALEKEGMIYMETDETYYISLVTDEDYEGFQFFWTLDDQNNIIGPFAIDNYYVEEENYEEVVEVVLTELDVKNLTAEYLQSFYLTDEEDYLILLEAATPVSNNSVNVENNSGTTLHFIMTANTLIADIGTTVKIDVHNTLSEFGGISSALGMQFNPIVLSDQHFDKANLTTTLESLRPSPNDVVIFWYSGHGFRFDDQAEIFPQMDLRYNEYQPSGYDKVMNINDVYNQIIQKGARLNIVVGDCCNSYIGVKQKAGTSILASRSSVNADINKLEKLFLESSGGIIAAGCDSGESSYGNNQDGGFYTSSFISALRAETSRLHNDDVPRWEDVLDHAQKTAVKKSTSCNNCPAQNPIYQETVN